MPNIATVLKSEISRIARKEMKAETATLKKSVSSQRVEIASLRKRLHILEQVVRALGRPTLPKRAAPEAAVADPAVLRFSAKGFATQRKRLGLSAAQCALIIGASGQTIYNWEDGTVKPRARHFAAIAEFRSMGRKAAMSKLQALQSET